MLARSLPVITAIAVLATAAPAKDPVFDPVEAEVGKPLYLQHCASCHGSEARGDGPARAALIKQPADLTAIAARRGGSFPTGEIAQFVDGRFQLPAHGSREMPIWGERFGADVPEAGLGESIARGNIASLLEYLKSIQRPPLTPPR